MVIGRGGRKWKPQAGLELSQARVSVATVEVENPILTPNCPENVARRSKGEFFRRAMKQALLGDEARRRRHEKTGHGRLGGAETLAQRVTAKEFLFTPEG